MTDVKAEGGQWRELWGCAGLEPSLTKRVTPGELFNPNFSLC